MSVPERERLVTAVFEIDSAMRNRVRGRPTDPWAVLRSVRSIITSTDYEGAYEPIARYLKWYPEVRRIIEREVPR